MRGIWKKVGWGICVVTMVIILVSIGLMLYIFHSCKQIQMGGKIYTSGDFVYSLNVDGDKLYLEDLSEQGKKKETIIIPKEIDGFSVTQYTYPAGIVGYHGSFESENLKQIYIVPSISIYTIYCNLAPNVEKIILIGADNDLNYLQLNSNEKTKIYLCRVDANQQVNDEGYIGQNYLWLSNCNYFYNYDEAENDGYYWSDNYDYGEKIAYVPQNPEREGYIFGGWFQEPECVNIWNFDTDTLPEAEYNEEGEALYQETRLYAKWYVE